jgi:hypothetical protein
LSTGWHHASPRGPRSTGPDPVLRRAGQAPARRPAVRAASSASCSTSSSATARASSSTRSIGAIREGTASDLGVPTLMPQCRQVRPRRYPGGGARSLPVKKRLPQCGQRSPARIQTRDPALRAKDPKKTHKNAGGTGPTKRWYHSANDARPRFGRKKAANATTRLRRCRRHARR